MIDNNNDAIVCGKRERSLCIQCVKKTRKWKEKMMERMREEKPRKEKSRDGETAIGLILQQETLRGKE